MKRNFATAISVVALITGGYVWGTWHEANRVQQTCEDPKAEGA